jgi:hypothetical protein
MQRRGFVCQGTSSDDPLHRLNENRHHAHAPDAQAVKYAQRDQDSIKRNGKQDEGQQFCPPSSRESARQPGSDQTIAVMNAWRLALNACNSTSYLSGERMDLIPSPACQVVRWIIQWLKLVTETAITIWNGD